MNSEISNEPLFSSTKLSSFRLITKYEFGAEFDLIVDANIILNDIRYMAKRREAKPALKTKMLELMVAGVLQVKAPEFLKVEIDKHIPLQAERYKIPIPAMEAEWKTFEALIEFTAIEERDEDQHARDPKDMSYIHLQKALEAPIISRDKDIGGMGGVTLQQDALDLLRGYARQESKMLGVHIAGGLSLRVSQDIADTLCNFLKGLGRMHWGWWLLIGLVALAFYKKIRNFVQNDLPFLYPVLEGLFQTACNKIKGFAQLQQQCFESKAEAKKIFNDLQQSLQNASSMNLNDASTSPAGSV